MSLDLLKLSQNDKIRKQLQGHSGNGLSDEIILYSSNVIKVNRKSKLQKRALVITNRAIYNFTHKHQLKRRITFNQIHTISVSTKCNDIVLHIPTEYDYLYRLTWDKAIDHIIRISTEYARRSNHKINVLQFELTDLLLIADNDKAKVRPEKKAADRYMLQKISKWQQAYHIHSYKQKYTKNGSIAVQIENPVYSNKVNKKEKVDIKEAEDSDKKEESDDSDSTSSAYYTGPGDDPVEAKIRSKWQPGDKIEVYSHSKRQWCEGKISKIYRDEMGEWLVVEYDNESMEKDLRRYDDDLRPLIKNISK